MKLEVGMYVRGKYYNYRGKIGKIIKNYNNDLEIAYKDGILKTSTSLFIDDNFDINGQQYVASFDIMDLIKAGDIIVNGSNEKLEVFLIDNELMVRNTGLIYDNNYYLPIKNITIKSIVTKEQFEQMSYKIEE